VPVGTLLGQQPQKDRRSFGWRAVVRWRDWSLPVKLSAVTLVPIIIALVLGVTTIANQVGLSDSYQRVDRLVALSADIRTLTDGLQGERTQAALVLIAGTVGGSPELTTARAQVDAAVRPFVAAAGEIDPLDSGIAESDKEAVAQVARLATVREQATAGKLDPAQAISEYTAMTSALLKLDTMLGEGIGNNIVVGIPSLLHDLQVAKEEVSLSQSLVDYGIARSSLVPSDLIQVRTAQVRLSDRLDDFRAAATTQQRQDFDATVAGPVDARASLANSLLGEQGPPAAQAFRQVSAQEWNQSSTTVIGRMNDLSKRLGDQIGAASAKLVDDSSSGAGLLAVLLFGALIVAAAVVFLITRQLLRSLQVLRASALDVAETQLPAAVRNIQEGRAQDSEVQPVPVNSNDEIGEVARAFDAVHHQALRLATEQAAMRTGYGSVFVNLSRRSQSLVQRQLQLIERLERDEEDADQLATLFQLDHLATRMRRNNENLMVLSGSEQTRRSGQPVSATDVLRAAVSEIEQYQRVVVQPPPRVKVVGHAVSDLMRLIAELLDNATAFSAPETRVTVATYVADDGSLQIDIVDKGIGMNEAEVAEANMRLTEAASVDLITSRRMGLFVVGRLASRHRIGVSLHGGKDIVGVRAAASVPAELVMIQSGQEGTGPIPVHQGPQATSPGGALPRRQRPVNGANRPGVAVPPQDDQTDGWPSPADAASLNGHTGQLPRPPSNLEISGAALFSPIRQDDDLTSWAVPGEQAAAAPVQDEDDAVVHEGTLPSGKELFEDNGTVLSDWWNQTGAGSEPVAPTPAVLPDSSETTPIFDEMVPAWFRSTAPAPEPVPAEKEDPEPVPVEKKGPANTWDFASDENWRTVQAVSQTPPSTFTAAGLPMRRRGEQLMPGSAAQSAAPNTRTPAARPELPTRDAADMRGRLSSFQQGINRGRKVKHDAEALEAVGATPTASFAPKPSRVAPRDQSQPEDQSETQNQYQATPPPRTEKRPLPQRTAKPVPRHASPAPAATSEPSGTPEVGRTSEWIFGSDDDWRTVRSAAKAVPATFTPAGLPKRRRGEQLLPGNAAVPAAQSGPRPERDPDDVRGRLSSFQQGIRRGRHRTAQSTEANQETLEGE
jgi:signal transduction histidine kinase